VNSMGWTLLGTRVRLGLKPFITQLAYIRSSIILLLMLEVLNHFTTPERHPCSLMMAQTAESLHLGDLLAEETTRNQSLARQIFERDKHKVTRHMSPGTPGYPLRTQIHSSSPTSTTTRYSARSTIIVRVLKMQTFWWYIHRGTTVQI
jgi:hypothetical protein